MPNHYFVIYKPFGYLSQFSSSENMPVLKSLYDFPKDVYPVGRLDKDSEGLLIITNDKSLNFKLLHPSFKHEREYWAQVERVPNELAINQLKAGVGIKVNKKVYQTLPAKATLMKEDPIVPDRNPPIRFRKNIPTAWLKLQLIEGKNRQVRKMTAKVGYPTLRLIRVRIANLRLENMEVGMVKKLSRKEIYRYLFDKN